MIASIVVLYNTCDEELRHIMDYSEKVDYIIVIDNSSKSSYERLKNIVNKEFEYRHYPENIGLCAALNIGVEAAKKSGCDWVLLMDADSSFETDIIDVYKYQISRIDEKVAVLSPVCLHDRSHVAPYNGTKEVKWAMTSGCLYRIDTFEKVGGFMEELFVDGLDIEYCYRARKKGYIILECGEAILNHHPADTKTVQVLWEKMKIGIASPWRYYMQARSLAYIILKYKSISDIILLAWKYVKVILWFEPKKSYISQMNKGIGEGIMLYRSTAKF